jgi:YbgC/YbaW family acyl-CoA thioester hydrolase
LNRSEAFSREELVSAAPVGAVYSHIIRFQDVDAAGVVFYPRILEYFHDAYVAFLRAAGHPVESAIAHKSWATPIRQVEATFLRPLRFGDPAETALVKVMLEGSDLSLGFRTAVRGNAAAIGVARHVFVDAATFKRREPPADLRDLLVGPARFEPGSENTR